MRAVLRPATRDDLELLVRFTQQEAREAEGRAADPARLRLGVGAALDDPRLARYWVVQPAGAQPQGNVSVVREWSDWNARDYWWIQSMYLRPAARGSGLVGQVLEELYSIAAREGALELRLYVHRDNERAVRAYAKHGFRGGPYDIMQRQIGSDVP